MDESRPGARKDGWIVGQGDRQAHTPIAPCNNDANGSWGIVQARKFNKQNKHFAINKFCDAEWENTGILLPIYLALQSICTNNILHTSIHNATGIQGGSAGQADGKWMGEAWNSQWKF